jgi:hypothetical protein
MNYDKLSILNICHYDKYKVFNVTDRRSNTLFRVSGVGEELPYEALRRMNVGQKQMFGKERLRYERIV